MFTTLLRRLAPETADLLPFPLKSSLYPQLDLSHATTALLDHPIYERDTLFEYVAARRADTDSPLLWGGYLEHRQIYSSSDLFQAKAEPRNIHLGIDFWAEAGTEVLAPLAGEIHSFQDNAAFRDYGPTIIVRHVVEGVEFHTLYGHLSRRSLHGCMVGMSIAKGQRIGWLGEEAENGQWPPHLHFQLMRDMQGKLGDYPGVCAATDLPMYQANCPDPRLLLGF